MVLLQESRGRMLTCQPPSLLLPPASHQAPTSGQADLGWLRHLGCWRRIAPFLRLLSFWRHGQGNSLAIVHTNHQGTSRLAPRPRSLQAVPKLRRTRPARRCEGGRRPAHPAGLLRAPGHEGLGGRDTPQLAGLEVHSGFPFLTPEEKVVLGRGRRVERT